MALNDAIKSEFTVFFGEENNGALTSGVEMNPLRVSDVTVEGETQKIESDVIIPDSRIPSTPESGSESNSGDISTEWNIDEQDPLFAAVMLNDWEEQDNNTKTLVLGKTRKTFSLLKKYSQEPIEYQLFKNEQINQLTMNFAVSDFVKLTWSIMGANHPRKETDDPLSELSPVYKEARTTKSFITLDGLIKLGNSFSELTANHQISSMSITINNNLERTDALFETEAVEMSLGDFNVSGSFDVLNSGAVARELYNDAVSGADKCMEVQVSRTIDGKKTSYTIQLKCHLDTVSESKDGNHLKYGINWTMNSADGIKFIKKTEEVY